REISPPNGDNRGNNRRCAMSSFRIAVDTDDQNSRRRPVGADAGERLARLAGLGLPDPCPLSAVESAGEVKLPFGYRNWFHVNAMLVDKASPLFDVLGGMHSVYVNPAGAAALKKGGPYPDKTVLVDDVREFTVSEGSYVEGASKVLGVMTKGKRPCAARGGWGSQAWAAGDPAKPLVTDATKQCFECHQARKDQDYVSSTYIP